MWRWLNEVAGLGQLLIGILLVLLLLFVVIAPFVLLFGGHLPFYEP